MSVFCGAFFTLSVRLTEFTHKIKMMRNVVKGRLPNNGKIDWNFEDGVVTVTSPDHPKLLIEIDTSREFSDTHQPTSSVLPGQTACRLVSSY